MRSTLDTSSTFSTLRTFGAKGPALTYDRFLVRFPPSWLTAQVIVVSHGRAQMSVHTHHDALNIDFKRHQVVDPTIVDTYLHRPGFYLHEKLAKLRKSGDSAILFNGNNIGYWGNQYVIRDHRLQYKRRGPIFDDGDLLSHAHNGDHAFFLAGEAGFRIERLALVGVRRPAGQTLEALDVPGRDLPRFGLSGFPLLRQGKSVWKEHGPLAWDPGLLFNLGRISRELTVTDLRAHVSELLESGVDLARHPMTVIGINGQGQVVLMVVERSADSRGMTVAEAADLLRRRFNVEDAIVLGAAGDAQLATTEEGFLTEPLVAEYAKSSARAVPDDLLHERLRGQPVSARPIPCFVQFDLVATDEGRHTRRSEPPGVPW